MLDYLTLITNTATIAFLAIGATYLYKQKRFEDEKLHNPIKLIFLSILLIACAFFLTLLQNTTFYDLNNLFTHLDLTTQHINYIGDILLMPMAGAFFVVSMLFLKKQE